jgi:hypothetical protein
MSDVYCHNLNCKNNDGFILTDSHGVPTGFCKLAELDIDKKGRCENDDSE